MTPIGELRVAIPIGMTLYQLPPATAYFVSVLGNLFVVFLILTFLGTFYRWISIPPSFLSSQKSLSKFPRQILYHFSERLRIKRFLDWLFTRTRKNHQEKASRYGIYFLPFFVAIPLPLTGGWTASLLAFIFGIPFKKAFPLISLGVIMAGVIVLFLTQVGITIERNFGWQVLLGIVVALGFIYWLLQNHQKS